MELFLWALGMSVTVFLAILAVAWFMVWVSHAVFGVEEHWLDYGVDEDDLS